MPKDLLIEIGCDELPPKALFRLGQAFAEEIEKQLQQLQLDFAQCHWFATPRRLAVLIDALQTQQQDQQVERKGPNLNAAFDKDGKPTLACLGFAKSCGVTVEELQIVYE